MRGRNAVDPELARVVEARLERLLAERGPRRAAADESAAPDGPGADVGDEDELDAGDPPDDPPSEDRLDDRRRVSRADRRADVLPFLRRRSDPDDEDAEPARSPLFTRAHLVVVGVLVALGLLLGGWALLRAQPVPLSTSAMAAPSPEPGAGSGAPSDGSPTSGDPSARGSPSPNGTPGPSVAALVVHVVGSVRKPGLVELSAGARVQDAIDAAGGLKPGAVLGDLNLAQPLADGQQVVVGRGGGRSEVRGGSTGGSTGPNGSGTGSAAPVDLNTATAAQLETLPGVGPVTAAKIIAWREEHGRFARVEELQEVSGIGPKTYAEIAPHCRV